MKLCPFKGIFFKIWIFTNFNMVFPVLVLVFDFEEFSEGVLGMAIGLREQ